MNYYRRFPGDYQRDTGHLSLAEHGAYSVLLDHYYSRESPLPAEMTALHRLCRAMTKIEQDAVTSVADAYFPVNGDGKRHNHRADDEIKQTESRRQTASDSGKKGGRPKNESEDESKNKANPLANQKPQQSREKALQTPDSRLQDQTPEQECSAAQPPTRVRRKIAPRETDPEWFLNFKLAYPERAGGDYNWIGGLRAAGARIAEGYTPEEFIAGAERYTQYLKSIGKIGTEYVKQASTFLGPGKHFLTPYTSAPTAADSRLRGNLSAADEFMRRTEPTDETV